MRELLLVDDQASEAKLAEHALALSGAQFTMTTRNSGPAGLQWLAERAARGADPLAILVLMDLNMPMVDGISTLRQIREHAELAATPVLILSNSSDAKDQDRANAAGADGYIWKPQSLPDLCKFFNSLDDFWFEHIASARTAASKDS